MDVGKRFPWVDFMHGLSDLNAFPMYFQIGLHKSSSRLFLITNVYWALSLWKALCLILGIHCLIWTSWQHQEAVLCQSLFNTQGHWIIQRRTWLFVLSSFSHVQLFETLWTVTYQPPLSMGFPRQKYWSGLPYSSPGDLSNPGIKPASLASSLASAGRFFTNSTIWTWLSSCN